MNPVHPTDDERLADLTQAIVALAKLDFSVRLDVRGSGPMEAIAVGLVALAEELEANVVARQVAEAANDSKARFLSTISHELRTPLTTMLGSVELLQQTHLNHRQQQHLQDLAQASRQLSQLIGNILEYTELDTQVRVFDERPFHLEDLVDSLIATHRPLAEHKLLRLDDARHSPIRVRVRGDRPRLEQLLANLLANAVHYTHQGSIGLHTRVHTQGDTAHLTFEVRDTGPGIPGDQLDHIFDIFARGDTTSTRRSGGLGLGLSIARRLAEGMGGSLVLAETSPAGSTFRVELALPLDASQPVPIPGVRPGSMQGVHVLLVEDTEPVRIVLATMMEILGCTVTAVESGFAALAQLETTRPDIILLDQEMPEMDGLETSRQLHARLGVHTPPIISITAHGAASDRERSRDAGMVDHITKPCDISTLGAVLARHVPQSPAAAPS